MRLEEVDLGKRSLKHGTERRGQRSPSFAQTRYRDQLDLPIDPDLRRFRLVVGVGGVFIDGRIATN